MSRCNEHADPRMDHKTYVQEHIVEIRLRIRTLHPITEKANALSCASMHQINQTQKRHRSLGACQIAHFLTLLVSCELDVLYRVKIPFFHIKCQEVRPSIFLLLSLSFDSLARRRLREGASAGRDLRHHHPQSEECIVQDPQSQLPQ